MKKNKIVSLIGVGLSLIGSFAVQAEDFIPKSTYNWTGVYGGGFVGAGGANIKASGPETNGIQWNSPGNKDNNYNTGGNFIGGGTLGYNWQMANTPYVLGLEAEYGYLDMDATNPDPNNSAYNAQFNRRHRPTPSNPLANGVANTNIGSDYGYGLVGGRIGYSMDRALLFVKSGAVFTSSQSGYTDANSGLNIQEKSKNNVGYAVGGGVEYALPFDWSKNVSVKTEYMYFGLNTSTTTNGVYNTVYGQNPLNYSTNIDGVHTAKVGMNYKF